MTNRQIYGAMEYVADSIGNTLNKYINKVWNIARRRTISHPPLCGIKPSEFNFEPSNTMIQIEKWAENQPLPIH